MKKLIFSILIAFGLVANADNVIKFKILGITSNEGNVVLYSDRVLGHPDCPQAHQLSVLPDGESNLDQTIALSAFYAGKEVWAILGDCQGIKGVLAKRIVPLM